MKVKVGDLVRINLPIGNNWTVGIVVETAGKYIAAVDWDGQRYSMSQEYVEVINENR